ncbi:alpha/beta fold hydrolase [Nocardia flavorosea]|uniref:Alpha/beta fold hydrolase n=1 Tax=Nocardia flavorosea TaxID=53429 RepID=A0A846YNG6_9NOCA|nr:alpha/beta fold hydrolase [Nocardia flavorosea]NKY58469.1 alpha/beta fold hydrolase [Nocardia flavorosea]
MTEIEGGRTVRIGDRDIYYTESGSGPTVLLLHGGGPGASGTAAYARNIDALARRFRVLVPDMPGYGRSSKQIDRSDPFGDLAASMAGLLNALEVRSAHVVGNSYGGAAALRMAMESPRKVERLVLAAPGGIGTTRALPTAGLRALLAYYGGNGPSREKLATFMREYLVHDPGAITDVMIDNRYRASLDPEVIANPPLRRPSGRSAPRTLMRMDLTRDPRLRRITQPTLVIWGAEDRVNRPGGAHMLARRIPNCDVYLPAATGHWVQGERPEFFNRLVTAFLAERP